mmetsp:Transcript_51510/g.101106  ORF Transcript_51510/g.101106 Transcript_51510/m.101106 type:complete len:81 (+) Transcript_51510:1324-1566(+)
MISVDRVILLPLLSSSLSMQRSNKANDQPRSNLSLCLSLSHTHTLTYTYTHTHTHTNETDERESEREAGRQTNQTTDWER